MDDAGSSDADRRNTYRKRNTFIIYRHNLLLILDSRLCLFVFFLLATAERRSEYKFTPQRVR